MSWTITGDWQGYIAEAGAFLRADPAANTVPLGVVETLRAQGTDTFGADPLFGWWAGADGVEGTVMQTGAYPVLLSDMPDRAAEELAGALPERPFTGVVATEGTARVFAEAWSRRTGTLVSERMRQRLYRLDGLASPDPPPPGTPRVAGPSDLSLVRSWFSAFEDEAGGTASENPRFVDDRMSYGGVLFWEVEGEPVSLAARTRVISGMARIGPVYTPVPHRGRGYGASVTAELSRRAMDAGAEHVVLFTDLANPTSNGIYRRIGYRPVGDRLLLGFAGP
jgi:predicted GNAT family acetyltransferase